MRLKRALSHSLRFLLAALVLLPGALSSCSPPKSASARAEGKPTIVVSYSVLGSLVRELVGEEARVEVLVPNGLDVHEWEPSARDIEGLMRADLVVVNGLGLEGGFDAALGRAREAGRPFFTAADHVEVRVVGEGEGLPGGDPDQASGARDPHLWTDPLAMRDVVLALAPVIQSRLGLDVAPEAESMARDLAALDADIAAEVASLPADRRVLVTGHESLGYFARRYGFTLVGALLPGLSTEAGSSASWLATLKVLIARYRVKAIFTEVGTPPQVVASMARETGARAVPLATHLIPEKGSLPDGSGGYSDFMRNLASTIVEASR